MTDRNWRDVIRAMGPLTSCGSEVMCDEPLFCATVYGPGPRREIASAIASALNAAIEEQTIIADLRAEIAKLRAVLEAAAPIVERIVALDKTAMVGRDWARTGTTSISTIQLDALAAFYKEEKND
jgi:hypothetical protein